MRIFKLLLLGSLILWGNSSFAEFELIGSEVIFKGKLIALPCTIDPESAEQSVDFDPIDVKILYKDGVSKSQPFSIRLLNCDNKVYSHATVTFGGKEDGDLKGYLAVSEKERGYAIGLYDVNDELLPLQKPSTSQQLNKEAVFTFSARVKAKLEAIEKQNIQIGSFSAISYFTVNYQ